MTEPASNPRKLRHKTRSPHLTAEDVKFAQLLFTARCKPGERSSVVRCYLEAGFPPRDTDAATVQAAYRRVKRRQFREFYRGVQDAAAVAASVTPELLTRLLKWIATFDLREVFDDRGRIKLPHEWSDAVAMGILAVKSDEMFENQSVYDPETQKTVRRKVLVGYTREVRRVGPTEAIRLLAQVMRLIGPESAGNTPPGSQPEKPWLPGGDAHPELL